jgi:hypothetical protein
MVFVELACFFFFVPLASVQKVTSSRACFAFICYFARQLFHLVLCLCVYCFTVSFTFYSHVFTGYDVRLLTTYICFSFGGFVLYL